jgi:hypothetical protein
MAVKYAPSFQQKKRSDALKHLWSVSLLLEAVWPCLQVFLAFQ